MHDHQIHHYDTMLYTLPNLPMSHYVWQHLSLRKNFIYNADRYQVAYGEQLKIKNLKFKIKTLKFRI
jgi:hypothetical protein